MKILIKNTLTDLMSNFLYYDRKEDDELGVDDIDKAINNGIISIDELTAQFKDELTNGINNLL